MICDCGTKSLPFTVNRIDAVSLAMAPGEREVVWGCGTELSQLLKSTIALQVVQPDNSRVRAAMQAMRTEGKGLQGLTRQERIPASLLQAVVIVTLAASALHGPSHELPRVLRRKLRLGRGVTARNVFPAIFLLLAVQYPQPRCRFGHNRTRPQSEAREME